MTFLDRYAIRLRDRRQSRERRNLAEATLSRVMRLRRPILQILQRVRLHQLRLRPQRLRTRATSAWRKRPPPRRTETGTCRTEFPCPENKAWSPVPSRQTVVTSTSGVFRLELRYEILTQARLSSRRNGRPTEGKTEQSRSQRNFSERPVFSLTKLNTGIL